MSSYILCQTKKAEKPYYIENISTNIYSIEELCYYLYHNLYLIDSTIINEGLCKWLEEELGLTRLAAKLRPYLGKFAGAEDILYPVFKEINYLTYEELRVLNGKIAKLNKEELPVREKKKGDALVENGMYVNAIHVYQNLLECSERLKGQPELTESIYHNLGCAYSYLFQTEKAMECFQKAYGVRNSEKEMKAYLLAYKSIHTPKEYEGRVKELQPGETVLKEIKEAVAHFERTPDKKIDAGDIDKMLEGFIKEYHRSTGA